ncbi:MAG: serine hydrolase [Chitinophagaceae bacterium]|jgi:CubicO group peptidase (beta-lactamase class C family)|nr:serine hydrolase [Chitinophagaceae bacterium]
MKKYTVFFFFLLVFTLQLSAQDFLVKADEYLNALANQKKFNGAVLVAKDNKVLFKKGYGYRDFDKRINHDAYSIFQIGSVTKQFTSAIIMQLQQEKKLTVKDEFGKVTSLILHQGGQKIPGKKIK